MGVGSGGDFYFYCFCKIEKSAYLNFSDFSWIVYNVVDIRYNIDILLLFTTNVYNFLYSSPGFINISIFIFKEPLIA